MFMFIGLLVFVGSARGAFVPRIVNGEDADIRDYPYQVSQQLFGSHSCGGSIISTTRILTAAHCTDQQILSTLTIRAGSSIRNQGGQVRSVSENHVHPEWNNPLFDNDVAVLVLSEPLILNDLIQIVQLAVYDNEPVGSYATVTGWGFTENNTFSDVLQKLDQEKVIEERCANGFFTYNPVTQICYGNELGKSACSSDSGGPLVQNGVQVGVVSYGSRPCVGETPNVYAKVSYFLPYIQSLM